MQTWFFRDIKLIISLLCPKTAQSSRHVHPLTLGCLRCGGCWLTCMMASFLNTHSRGTARGGRDSKALQQTSPSKQASPPAQHSSFQAPHPIPSSFTSPSPIPPPSPHIDIHKPHAHFPTKRLFSGPHAGQMFLMTPMPAAHQHDATNPMMFSASSSQPGPHTPREKEGKEEEKRKTRD